MIKKRSTFSLVIVHGRSEFELVQSIKQFMRLNLVIYAKDKGRSSIQISSLPRLLKRDKKLKDCKSIVSNYPGILHDKYKRLNDFTIYTLMDIDDVENVDIKDNYLAGHLSNIKEYKLKEYITPIYCMENLEDVLNDINFEFVAKNDKDKKKYIKVFDPNDGTLANEKNMENFIENIKKSKKTNMDDCVKHRLKL